MCQWHSSLWSLAHRRNDKFALAIFRKFVNLVKDKNKSGVCIQNTYVCFHIKRRASRNFLAIALNIGSWKIAWIFYQPHQSLLFSPLVITPLKKLSTRPSLAWLLYLRTSVFFFQELECFPCHFIMFGINLFLDHDSNEIRLFKLVKKKVVFALMEEKISRLKN